MRVFICASVSVRVCPAIRVRCMCDGVCVWLGAFVCLRVSDMCMCACACVCGFVCVHICECQRVSVCVALGYVRVCVHVGVCV